MTWNLFPACLTCYHRDLTTQEILIQVGNINCDSPQKCSFYICLNWQQCRLPVLINSEQCSERSVRKHAFVHRAGNLGFVSVPSLTGAGLSKFGSNPGELFLSGWAIGTRVFRALQLCVATHLVPRALNLVTQATPTIFPGIYECCLQWILDLTVEMARN
jgi:hypothetical protein